MKTIEVSLNNKRQIEKIGKLVKSFGLELDDEITFKGKNFEIECRVIGYGANE